MNPIEYLDAAKTALNVKTDNALAVKMEIHSGVISGIREGKRGIPLELAFKIAITLNLDPARVVADLESQRASKGKRGDFWRGFLSRVTLVAVLVCTLALNFSATQGSAAARLGGKNRRFHYA